MTLEIDVLTLFPAMLEGPLSDSIPGRIRERGLARIQTHDLRRWGLGRHRSVDDATYGGGAGMILRPEPVAAALDELRRADSTVILLDPAGEPFRQARAHQLAELPHLILVCPRYEGVDERIRGLVDLEISIGDYVLTGGDHGAVRTWRLKESLRRTLLRRPDLLVERPFSPEEERLRDEVAREEG